MILSFKYLLDSTQFSMQNTWSTHNYTLSSGHSFRCFLINGGGVALAILCSPQDWAPNNGRLLSWNSMQCATTIGSKNMQMSQTYYTVFDTEYIKNIKWIFIQFSFVTGKVTMFWLLGRLLPQYDSITTYTWKYFSTVETTEELIKVNGLLNNNNNSNGYF